MHDSITIAVAGGMAKVSGSRIATPFAPPSPGSTPTMTPRNTPTNISIRVYGDSTTENPCISKVSSSKASPDSSTAPGGRSIPYESQHVVSALGQQHQEPHLEHQEQREGHAESDRKALVPGILANPDHESRD